MTPAGKGGKGKDGKGRPRSTSGGKGGKKGRGASPGAREGGKNDKNKRDFTYGKGGRPLYCCIEFADTGKCTFSEKFGKPCPKPQAVHYTKEQWLAEYKRLNPDYKP